MKREINSVNVEDSLVITIKFLKEMDLDKVNAKIVIKEPFQIDSARVVNIVSKDRQLQLSPTPKANLNSHVHLPLSSLSPLSPLSLSAALEAT
jgi:hypothetical protein